VPGYNRQLKANVCSPDDSLATRELEFIRHSSVGDENFLDIRDDTLRGQDVPDQLDGGVVRRAIRQI
jgi:hypothetical protein